MHVTRRATTGLPYASAIDFMLAVDGNNPSGGGGTPLINQEDDDNMLMLIINDPQHGKQYKTALGNATFRHFISTDNPDFVMKVERTNDDWQTIDISQLPVFLRTHACDLHIYDYINGDFAVLDPLTGKVAAGNVWSAVNQLRADMAKK